MLVKKYQCIKPQVLVNKKTLISSVTNVGLRVIPPNTIVQTVLTGQLPDPDVGIHTT